MIESNLKKYFNKKNVFTRTELFQFYIAAEPELNKNTFAWRIYNLKRKGVIKAVGRGVYSFSNKSSHALQLSKYSKKAALCISKTFTDIIFCISDSTWINEFTGHQYSNNFTIIEIEKELLESVFYNLKEKFKTLFLKPNEIELERYISDLNTAIILIPFVTRAPIQKLKNIEYPIPTLEKLIVDIYAKASPYSFLTNSEITTIIINAFKKYNINETTLLAYAARRGKGKEIRTFLKEERLFEAAND